MDGERGGNSRNQTLPNALKYGGIPDLLADMIED